MSDFAYTYVLECGDGKLYVGSTIDLKRRVEEHLRGVVPATQYRLPVRLVCYEACRAFRHRPDGRNDPRSVAPPSRLRHRTGHGVSPAPETPGSARVRLSHPLFSGPHPPAAAFSGCGRAPKPEKPVFDFRAHFCHSAPMETHAFGFRLPANAPDGQKRFPISARGLSICQRWGGFELELDSAE